MFTEPAMSNTAPTIKAIALDQYQRDLSRCLATATIKKTTAKIITIAPPNLATVSHSLRKLEPPVFNV